MKSRSGQIIIEVMVAAIVIIMVSLAISELINSSVRATEASNANGTATFLSGEMIDATRAVAREDWHNISSLATSSSNLYHPVVSGGKWTLAAGSASVPLNSITYTTATYFTDVYRSTSTGDIVSTGGYYDPSTIKVNASVTWLDTLNNQLSFSQVEYLSRYYNQTYAQTDWSGGSAGDVVVSAATTTFSTSTNIDSTSTAGSLQLVTQ